VLDIAKAEGAVIAPQAAELVARLKREYQEAKSRITA